MIPRRLGGLGSVSRRGCDAGLTLIEMLVSLAIFAVIGMAGLAVLDTVARTGERTEGRVERLGQIDRAFLILRRDLAQLAPGSAELDSAGLHLRRFVGDEIVPISFTLDGETLFRRIGADTGTAQRILPDVAEVGWRLLDPARTWHTVWPPGEDAPPPPVAAELTLDLLDPGSGPVTRLMVLPAGAGR